MAVPRLWHPSLTLPLSVLPAFRSRISPAQLQASQLLSTPKVRPQQRRARPEYRSLKRYLPLLTGTVRGVHVAAHVTPVEEAANRVHTSSPASARSCEGRIKGTPSFQEAVLLLQEFWGSRNCAVLTPSNTEVGAGTMNPATFLRVLGPEPWNVVYIEPSVRPDDSRGGENPNRLQKHHQFQVILKPDPGNPQELYLQSLEALGIDTKRNDVRFVEDNWESPVLGAWGLGWEVWLNGMEITQFTYFQQAGSLPLKPVSVEITYGLERILMSLQGVDHFKKMQYAPGITYGELHLETEKQMSAYNMEHADVERLRRRFDLYDEEARAMLEHGLAIPAYDHVCKSSHAFNVLDARGAVGVTERAYFFGRMRTLARQCAQLWVETREQLGYPLGVVLDPLPPQVAASEPATSPEPRTFLLEIGSEELPPQDVTSAISQLEAAVPGLLNELRLAHGKVSVLGTPRRLVVLVEGMVGRQPDSEDVIRGPPASKAIGPDGRPTKAGEGFCKKNGVSFDSVVVKSDGKAEYVYATVRQQGRPSVQVLAERLPGLVASLSFPKTMRWNSQAAYSRPLRWLLALHGSIPIPFASHGVASGRTTRTLRNLPSPSVHVENAEEYISAMKEAGIVLNMQERSDRIWGECEALALAAGGQIPEESRTGGLLQEVANLVEAPLPILGHFDESFLQLPREVLITVLKKHQRYFPVQVAATGRLLPAFIAVANGAVDEDLVRKGNESVLRARYEDAKFFYASDTSKPLGEFRGQLSGITFQEKLGTMLEKSLRIERLVPRLAAAMGISEAGLAAATTAAPLSHADLSTSMVMEFTNLAGSMGRHYALRQGLPSEVAEAIYESVLPRSAGDVLPQTEAGVLLAIADRLDSLVGLFAVGCQPSATTDPFGLRRSAYGLVQSLVSSGNLLDLREALSLVAAEQPVPVSDSALAEVQVFITRRVEQLLVDAGSNVEIVRAVLAERSASPALAAQSVAQVEAVGREDPTLLSRIVAAYARPIRIVRGKEAVIQPQVDPSLFEANEEKALWDAYLAATTRLSQGAGLDRFLRVSEELLQPLEAFFTNVFVMAEEEEIRANRITLCSKIASLPSGALDLSILPGF